jgi:hypothetical protein
MVPEMRKLTVRLRIHSPMPEIVRDDDNQMLSGEPG